MWMDVSSSRLGQTLTISSSTSTRSSIWATTNNNTIIGQNTTIGHLSDTLLRVNGSKWTPFEWWQWWWWSALAPSSASSHQIQSIQSFITNGMLLDYCFGKSKHTGTLDSSFNYSNHNNIFSPLQAVFISPLLSEWGRILKVIIDWGGIERAVVARGRMDGDVLLDNARIERFGHKWAHGEWPLFN